MFEIYKLDNSLQKQENEEIERKKLISKFNKQPTQTQFKHLKDYFQKKRRESSFLDIYIKEKDYNYQKKIIETGNEFLKSGNYFASFVCIDEVESISKGKVNTLNRAIVIIEGLRNKNLPKEKQYENMKIQINEEMYENRAIMLLEESDNVLAKFTKYLFLIERNRFRDAISTYLDFVKDLKQKKGTDAQGYIYHSKVFLPYKQAKLNLILADYCKETAKSIIKINPTKAFIRAKQSIYFYQRSLDNIDEEIREKPDNFSAYMHRAEVFEKLGKHREANICYKHIFKKNLT